MMIKAIIFDFYGVICSENYWNEVKLQYGTASAFKKIAAEMQLGSLSWKDFVQNIATQTGKSVEEINQAYQAEVMNLPLVTYISQLHSKYKTAILSNAASESFELRAKELGLDKIFDYTAVSSKLGMIKPDPKIYRHVLDKLDITAKEAVYIDDVVRYVDAARNLGIKSIHYQDFPQMKRELEALLSDANN